MNRRYQVELQPETLATVSIPLRQNAEHLQAPHDVFATDAFLRETTIPLFIVNRQGVMLGLSLGGRAVRMALMNPLIAAVRHHPNPRSGWRGTRLGRASYRRRKPWR